MAWSKLCLWFLLFGIKSVLCGNAPHILFILADDLGYRDVGYSGAEFSTPAIDKLANDGIILSRYYVHKMCSPTRSTILTGKYSWKLGIPQAFVCGSSGHIPSEEITLGELLKSTNKYSTHYVGKWHVGHASFNMTPIEKGFDTSYGIFQGENDFYTHSLFIGGYDFWEDKNVDKSVIGNYSADLYVDRVSKILNNYVNSQTIQQEEKSLFIYLSFQLVHAPMHIPPETFSQCNRHNIPGEGRRVFCNMAVYMDKAISKIKREMQRLNLFKDTIVIFSTDNGGLPNHNGIFDHTTDDPHGVSSHACNSPYRGGKRTNFEGGVKGVSFISGGALKNYVPNPNMRNGIRNENLFHAVDWLPTIIEGFADVDSCDNNNVINSRLEEIDGKNMLPALNNNDNWNRENLYLHIEDFGSQSAIIYKNEWKYISGSQQYTFWYHCNSIYPDNKLDLAHDISSDNADTKEWLFNIIDDPIEQFNLINDNSYSDILKEIKKHIKYKVYSSGEYVTAQENEILPVSFYINYCNIWYPWLDLDGPLDCNTLNAQAIEKQKASRKTNKQTNGNMIETEREGVYANTEWATAHGGPRNNDFISSIDELPEYYTGMAEVLGDYEAAVLLGPVRGPEGNFYMATGKGAGYSNFHCFDSSGNLLWQTLPWYEYNTSRFDACGIYSSAIVDEDGDIYISDCNQMWAFHNNGDIKWVTNLPDPLNPSDTDIFDHLDLPVKPINFGNPFFTIPKSSRKDALVGGITLWGDIILFNRETGEIVNEIVNMPGTIKPEFIEEPEGASPPPFIAEGYGSVVWTYFQGGLESSNVPAVHPETGRIYATGYSSKNNGNGAVHGFTINNNGKINFDYEAELNSNGSGSSPAITNDYKHLYVSDGQGNLYKFRTDRSARQTWMIETGAQPASVTVGGPGDDKAYMFSDTSVVARDPNNGDIVWEFNLLNEAAKYLPIDPINTYPKMCDYAALPNAIPVTIPGKVIVSAALGYKTSFKYNFFCNTKMALPIYSLQGVWELDSETGAILRDMIPAKEGNEAFTIPTSDGLLLMDRGTLTSGINLNYIDDFGEYFPEDFPPYLPIGGIEILQGMDSITIKDNKNNIIYSVGFELEDSSITKIKSNIIVGEATDPANGDKYFVKINKNTNNGNIKIFNSDNQLQMDIIINDKSNLKSTHHSIYGTGFLSSKETVQFHVSDWRNIQQQNAV